VLELADHGYTSIYTHSAIGLALTLQAQGAPEEATAIVEDLQQRLGALRYGQMLRVAKAFAADLATRQGRLDDALRWLAEDASNLTISAVPMFYVPGLAAVRLLIATGAGKDLADAQAWLDRVLNVAVHTHNVHVHVQALALQAAISDAHGDRSQALKALNQSLMMAERGGLIRVFVDLGRQLAPLLALLPSPAVSNDFLSAVRSAVESDLAAETRADPAVYAAERSIELGTGEGATGSTTAKAGDLSPSLATPQNGDYLHQILTHREMDVLRLLDQRLTNKEIARQLGISTETVRQHTIRLFRKLSVKNRRQAIVAARSLGLASGEE
jgi:LuxR family maltose regulon positive regulatory protein